MRRLPFLLPAVTLLVGLAVPATASAGSPGLSLHNDRPSISATGHPKFSYRTHDLRPGSQVALQVRDAGHWTTLARSSKRSGSFTVGGPGELGSYRFRALVVRHGTVVTQSGIKTVHAYGAVSMKALCHGVLDNYCVDGTRTLDDGTKFHYVMATGVNEPSDPWTAQLGAASSSCNRIRFTYISDSQDHTNTYLELRQPGHKTVKHTSSSAKIGSFTADLYGTKFGMSVEQDSAQVFMYFAGRASCWSATGKR